MNKERIYGLLVTIVGVLGVLSAHSYGLGAKIAVGVGIAFVILQSFTKGFAKATDYSFVTIIGLLGSAIGAGVEVITNFSSKWGFYALVASQILVGAGRDLKLIFGKKEITTIGMMILLVLPLTGCPGQEINQKKLVKASHDIFAGLRGVSGTLIDLNNSHKITDADEIAIRKQLDKVAQGVSKFKKRVIELDTITTDNKADLEKILDATLKDLDDLNSQSSLVPDATRQQEIRDSINLLRAGLGVYRASLALVKAPVKASSLPLDELAPSN